MDSSSDREGKNTGCGGKCCGTAPPPPQAQPAASDAPVARPVSNENAINVEEPCSSGCCEPKEPEILKTVQADVQDEATGCASACCGNAVVIGDRIESNCCGTATPLLQTQQAASDAPASASTLNDSVSRPMASENACSSGCCGAKEPEILPTVEADVQAEASGCASSCCGGAVIGDRIDVPPLISPESVTEEPDEGACGGGCYRTESTPVEVAEVKAGGCNDGCCTTAVEQTQADDSEDDCCGGKPPAEAQKCKDACYTSESMKTPAKDCCKGKPKPCCDEDCVDRLVLRECDSECVERGAKGYKCSSDASASRNKDRECCPNGINARKFYRNLLRSLGCLCGTVKARGGETCCVDSSKSSFDSSEPVQTGYKRERNARLRQSKIVPSTRRNECAGDDCCVIESSTQRISREKVHEPVVKSSSTLTPSRLENGVDENNHVVLSVSGMTCVGCETKLQRSLATIKAVQNLKTSLVLCRAEFDLDAREATVESIILQLQRMTEFKYEELKQDGSEIEVCPQDVTSFVKQDLPAGVISLRLVDKSTVSISFDPSIIGSRDLVERKFNLPLAPIKPDPSLAAGSKHVRHVGLVTLLSAALTIPVLVLAWAPLRERPIVYGGISLALASLVQFVIAGPFYPTALKSLIFARMIEMDLLIVISTSAAHIFSVVAFGYMVAGKPLPTGQFFETSTLLVTLIMVGRWVSALARQKAIESVSVRSLQTSTTLLVEGDEGDREIDSRLLQYGDVFRVPPESRIPTDGTVIAGISETDESTITGESLPVYKQPGSVVIAGSINGAGALTVRLSRLPGNNTISAIANMVDEAKLSKPKIQDIADRVASYFVPSAIVLALLVFIVWIPIGLRVRGYSSSRAITEALTYAITVIIVSCPCAIGLAVPMVIVIAGGVASRHGCIFKTAATIEVARKTSHVVFDKTGTLTEGKLTVAAHEYFQPGPSLRTIHMLVANIKHPVSLAVKEFLSDNNTPKQNASNVTSYPGKGVEGTINGKVVRAGNSRWLGFSEQTTVIDFLSQGYTTLCVTIDGKLVAVFGLQDSLRSDAVQTVTELQRRGIKVSMVSGDDESPVAVVARQLHITSLRSKCSPADKLQFMKSLTDAGETTIFCGDGTNDAAALAQATVGIHMNGGTEIAQSAADVVLVRSSLIDILTLIDLSKASMRRIAFNFGWSFVYNTLAILFASGALVRFRIPPEFAGLGELVSVLPVIAIAVQLRWAKFSETPGR